MTTITSTDSHQMLRFGALVAKKDDRFALESAAENLAVSLLEGDVHQNNHLTWEFAEGVRNNRDGMYHYDAIMARLKDRAIELAY